MKQGEIVRPPPIVYDTDPVTGRRRRPASREKLDEQGQRSSKTCCWCGGLDPDEDYAIGADVAEGLEHGDRSSLDVTAKSDGRQVAHWFGHSTRAVCPTAGPRWQVLRHRRAWPGLHRPRAQQLRPRVLLKLREIYPTRRITQEHIDRDRDDETPRLAGSTTRQSKLILVDGLKALLRAGQSGIRWIGTISEATTYVYDKSGSMNAQDGCYDDQLMSYA